MNSCLENLSEKYQFLELCVDLRKIKGLCRHALTMVRTFNLKVFFSPYDVRTVSKNL
jgi:hypothetical protein